MTGRVETTLVVPAGEVQLGDDDLGDALAVAILIVGLLLVGLIVGIVWAIRNMPKRPRHTGKLESDSARGAVLKRPGSRDCSGYWVTASRAVLV